MGIIIMKLTKEQKENKQLRELETRFKSLFADEYKLSIECKKLKEKLETILGEESFEEIIKEYKEYKELIEGIGHG